MSKRKSKHMCCECVAWEMGETWGTNPSRRPGTPVCISEGWCKSPGRKHPKRKWSHAPACDHLDLAPRMGFMVCGQGVPTAEVMDEIVRKTKELMEE